MKGLLCACLLASLQSMGAAQAYEADIHYSTTYVLARAAGWNEADARTIASANQGVDENEDTVAALEADFTASPSLTSYLTSSLRQAKKNLEFHCFSRTASQSGRIPADVRNVMAGHFAQVSDHDASARGKVRRLVALGVALHCQQDAHSHVDFGGSCGAYAGTCYGHTHETLVDQVLFRFMGKHFLNPDHPAVSGARLLEALEDTAGALVARAPDSSRRTVPARELIALSYALRESGLELPDEVRRDCNRYVAGRWLFERLRRDGAARSDMAAVQTLAPDIAISCHNPSLEAASVIRIPNPRYPRLTPAGTPSLVNADGTYQSIPGGLFDDFLPGIHAARKSAVTRNDRRPVTRVQLSHWSQILALPLVGQVAARPEHLSVMPPEARNSPVPR